MNSADASDENDGWALNEKKGAYTVIKNSNQILEDIYAHGHKFISLSHCARGVFHVDSVNNLLDHGSLEASWRTHKPRSQHTMPSLNADCFIAFICFDGNFSGKLFIGNTYTKNYIPQHGLCSWCSALFTVNFNLFAFFLPQSFSIVHTILEPKKKQRIRCIACILYGREMKKYFVSRLWFVDSKNRV